MACNIPVKNSPLKHAHNYFGEFPTSEIMHSTMTSRLKCTQDLHESSRVLSKCTHWKYLTNTKT